MKSEQTKDMTPEELAEMQEQAEQACSTEEGAREFRAQFEPDEMGFSEEESENEAEEEESRDAENNEAADEI